MVILGYTIQEWVIASFAVGISVFIVVELIEYYTKRK